MTTKPPSSAAALDDAGRIFIVDDSAENLTILGELLSAYRRNFALNGADALAWLVQCGKQFDIALDHPTDPNAPPLPAARPRSPEIAPIRPNASGLPGADDIEKIGKWDASELRNSDGRVGACYIRARYGMGSDSNRLLIASLFFEGEPGGMREAYRYMYERLPRLVGAQLLAILLVAVLVITIIGIPFALYFYFAWQFVQQEIIFRDARVREAFSGSDSRWPFAWQNSRI